VAPLDRDPLAEEAVKRLELVFGLGDLDRADDRKGEAEVLVHLGEDVRDDGQRVHAREAANARGLGQAANRILYVWGDQRTIGFTNYTTRVHALDF
jgi:hypothetical protein